MCDKSNEKGEQTPNLAKRKLNERNVELDQKRIKMDSSQVAVPKRGEGVVCFHGSFSFDLASSFAFAFCFQGFIYCIL